MKSIVRLTDRLAALVAPKAKAQATPVRGHCYGATCGGYGAWYTSFNDTPGERRPCC